MQAHNDPEQNLCTNGKVPVLTLGGIQHWTSLPLGRWNNHPFPLPAYCSGCSPHTHLHLSQFKNAGGVPLLRQKPFHRVYTNGALLVNPTHSFNVSYGRIRGHTSQEAKQELNKSLPLQQEQNSNRKPLTLARHLNSSPVQVLTPD